MIKVIYNEGMGFTEYKRNYSSLNEAIEKEGIKNNTMQKIYSVYADNQKKLENKAFRLLAECGGCFVLGFCFYGFLYVTRFYL